MSTIIKYNVNNNDSMFTVFSRYNGVFTFAEQIWLHKAFEVI